MDLSNFQNIYHILCSDGYHKKVSLISIFPLMVAVIILLEGFETQPAFDLALTSFICP